MTPAQRMTLGILEKQGFKLEVEIRDIVRVSLNGERRVILADGTQKRGHDVAHQQDKARQQHGQPLRKKPARRRG